MYFEKPIQANKKYVMSQKLIDIQDKVKATVTINESKIVEAETGDLACTIHRTTFIKGIGGFGYKGKMKSPIPALPKTAPNVQIEEKTNENCAFFYRLLADHNPLHVDPDMSALGGFETPILHGLASVGFTARMLQQHFFKDTPEMMKQFTVRFMGVVYPGETLVVSAWKNGDTIVFTTQVKERKGVCLLGMIVLHPQQKL